MLSVVRYNGVLPIEEETVKTWLAEGVTRVRIEFVASIDDMIWVRDMDEWNDFVDERVGVSLTDLAYGFAKSDPEDDLDDQHALLFVEGDLDGVSL